MNIKIISVLTIILLIAVSCNNNRIQCRIETSEGNIDIELYPEKAPITVANFMKYVDLDLYKESNFFRVCTPENEKDKAIKIEVIQGGDLPDSICFPPIKLESTNNTGIKHTNGAISMARAEANTATCSFFICIGDQAELDYNGKRNPDGQGFAAFGKVIKGMDVVKKIQHKKNIKQMLVDPVTIKTIRRI